MNVRVSPKIKCADCFRSLGINSRMEIYNYLYSKGPAAVSLLVKVVNLKQPTVSYHLKEMEATGLIKSKKAGKEVYYSLRNHCAAYDNACVLSSIKLPA